MGNAVKAGRYEKGDLLVSVEKRTKGGIALELKSSVANMYGKTIKTIALDTLQRLGIEHAVISIEDRGALNHVIQARIETTVRKLWNITGAGAMPQRKISWSPSKKDRLRRTRLYLPGNNPDLMLNAGLFGADCVILDLEDSVAPPYKDEARLLVRNSLVTVDFMRTERIVRINPLNTDFGKLDLEMVVPAQPHTILIPKCETREDVTEVEKILHETEKEHNLTSEIFLMPLIETAKGVINAYEIASASERVVAICFGAEDYTADIGVERTPDGNESFVARNILVIAAKAAGVQAIDTVYSDVADEVGLIKSTEECISLGFEGKGVIHPAQIEPIHAAFAPSPERIEHAQKVISAIEEAEKQGSGVVSLGTKMIDAPVVARAKRTIELAQAMGLLYTTEAEK